MCEWKIHFCYVWSNPKNELKFHEQFPMNMNINVQVCICKYASNIIIIMYGDLLVITSLVRVSCRCLLCPISTTVFLAPTQLLWQDHFGHLTITHQFRVDSLGRKFCHCPCLHYNAMPATVFTVCITNIIYNWHLNIFNLNNFMILFLSQVQNRQKAGVGRPLRQLVLVNITWERSGAGGGVRWIMVCQLNYICNLSGIDIKDDNGKHEVQFRCPECKIEVDCQCGNVHSKVNKVKCKH